MPVTFAIKTPAAVEPEKLMSGAVKPETGAEKVAVNWIVDAGVGSI